MEGDDFNTEAVMNICGECRHSSVTTSDFSHKGDLSPPQPPSSSAAASLRADLEGISRVKNNTAVPAPFVVGGNWIYIFEFAPTFSQPRRDKYPKSSERSVNDVAATSAGCVPEKSVVVFVLFSKAAAFQVNKK